MSHTLDDDPRDDLKIKAQDDPTPGEADADTEGHSMQLVDLARTMSHERDRQSEKATRTNRMRNTDAAPKSGIRGLFKRGG